MNDANKRTLLDWFKELKINKLLNVNIGGMTSGAGLATEATLNDIKTSVQTLDNIVSGNEAQVDIVASLPIGSNVIGKVSIDQTTPGVTNFVQNKEMPDDTATYSIIPYTSAALEASAIVKASAGNLYGFVVTNNNASTRYIQIFNSATLPADGAIPALTIPVPAGAVLPFDTGKFPNYFTNGIVICNSTTQITKTIGAADSLFYVQYK